MYTAYNQYEPPERREDTDLNGSITLLAAHGLKLGLVILRPLPDRKLGDLHGRIIGFLNATEHVVLVVPDLLDNPLEAAPPRHHGHLLLAIHEAPDVGDDLFGVEAWDRRAPTCRQVSAGHHC